MKRILMLAEGSAGMALAAALKDIEGCEVTTADVEPEKLPDGELGRMRGITIIELRAVHRQLQLNDVLASERCAVVRPEANTSWWQNDVAQQRRDIRAREHRARKMLPRGRNR